MVSRLIQRLPSLQQYINCRQWSRAKIISITESLALERGKQVPWDAESDFAESDFADYTFSRKYVHNKITDNAWVNLLVTGG